MTSDGQSRADRATSVSVVIPTHNRRLCLLQCLDALAAQTFELHRLEVIVVADGCSDGTETALASAQYPYPLRVLAQPAAGASAARNRGAAAAQGPLLIFLDDDVIPSPDLVQAHVNAHATARDCVAVGPYPLGDPRPGDFLGEVLHLYWKQKLKDMAVEGRQADFRDIVSGNLSLSASLFATVGGFSTRFNRLEDYEFGVRVLAAGARFVFAADAHALHLETTDLDRSLRMTRRVGKAEVLLATIHPQVLPKLRVSKRDRLAYLFTFHAPGVGRRVAEAAPTLLGIAERLRMRSIWWRLYGRLKVYWYWRGVADEVENYPEWSRRAWAAHRQCSGISPAPPLQNEADQAGTAP
jgi:GT2 family glycosyltransferase